MKTKYNTNRTDQFNGDLNWGKWGESTMWPWIENFFTRGDKKLSYWYDSDYEVSSLNLKGLEKKKMLKSYDLKFGLYYGNKIFCEKEIKFEIKTDKYANTGNLAFEYKDNGVESGVFTTTAEYFIYFMPRFETDNIYIIKSEKLKNLLSEEKWNIYFHYGGDIGKTLNFIIPKNEFDSHFIASGGKIETITDVSIPSEFGLSRFNENGKVVYHGTTLKKYDDDLNF